MKRLAVFCSLAVIVGLLFAPSALAANPHFKKGGTPVCEITGSGSSRTVVCTGTLAGLGNEDLVVAVTVSGFAVYQCRNQGGNIAPGQNKVLEGPVTEPTVIPSDAIKNGTVRFTTDPVTLTAEPTVSAAEAGCPNDNWIGVNPTLTLTSITVRITQGDTFIYCRTVSDPAGLTGTIAFPRASNCN